MKIGLSKVEICFQGWQSFHFIHVPVVKALFYEYGKARYLPNEDSYRFMCSMAR